jgi:hypothetical protein
MLDSTCREILSVTSTLPVTHSFSTLETANDEIAGGGSDL